MQRPIYILHYNHDYNESTVAVRTPDEALASIAENFEPELEPSHPDFSRAVDEAYANRNWKGFTVNALDPETLALVSVCVSDLAQATLSAHARLTFEKTLRDQLAKKVRRTT